MAQLTKKKLFSHVQNNLISIYDAYFLNFHNMAEFFHRLYKNPHALHVRLLRNVRH